MKKLLLMKTVLLLFALVVGSGSSWAAVTYKLVKNISELAQGDVILITSAKNGSAYALGNTQNSNNRSAVSVSISEETISTLGNAQEVTLESKSGGNFTLKVGDSSYLYAANSAKGSNNYLRSKNDNAIYWSITVNTTSYVAAVTDETSDCNNRKKLKYNSSSTIYSCYSSADNNLFIFKKQPSSDPSISAANVNIAYDATSGEISYEITNAVDGAAVEASTSNDWISDISVNGSTKKVSFSTSINEGVANRVGTITLNYKKGGETLATKAVTITQAYLVLADPVFSDVTGIYRPLDITITCSTGGSQIYYTIDGSDPKTNGTLYSTAISVNETTTIKAVSKKSGYYRNVVEATYTIDPHLRDFSWDLSTDNTATATESAMTWTGTYASMAAAKADATTNTNNYYPGTPNESYTSTRFYKNSTLTITPVSGYDIKSIVFEATTESYASALQSSTWTNATAVVSGTTVTITPIVGTSAVSATIGGTCGFTNVTVKYHATATITLNDACTDGDYVYGTYSNSQAFVVSDDIEVSEVSVVDGKLFVDSYSTGDVVPANTGVLVAALAGGNYDVTLSAEAGTSVLGNDNMLKPSGDAGITAENMNVDNTKFYRLTMHNYTQLGFWWGAENGAAFALAANKAYLAVPTTNSVREGLWIDDDATGVRQIENAELRMQNSFFNLAGQRVTQPTKGLYIVNGKKVVIK